LEARPLAEDSGQPPGVGRCVVPCARLKEKPSAVGMLPEMENRHAIAILFELLEDYCDSCIRSNDELTESPLVGVIEDILQPEDLVR